MTLFGLLLKAVVGIPPSAIRCERRGFRVTEARVRVRIEEIGLAFRRGYHTALVNGRISASVLEAEPSELRGFAAEGAGMGLAVLDQLTPWKSHRVETFLKDAGDPHAYMVYIAVGWMAARLPVNPERVRGRFDPLLGWLLYDGYGFHEGFFNWRSCLGNGTYPTRVRGYARKVFDQGLGRSLWFVEGADAGRIAGTIEQLRPERHADLWSGVGLAATYAGGVDEDGLRAVLASCGPHGAHLAQGAAFAAKARQRAGNVTDHTERACQAFCGTTAVLAAHSTDEALENLPFDGSPPAYEIWRQRIQARWTTVMKG